MKPRQYDKSVRIIGGKWRGRKISFAGSETLRPSPSRIRETLFNWLQPDIAGARVLEPFAGSGVLSFEALSRGASHVTLLDIDPRTTSALAQTVAALGCETASTIRRASATEWLAACDQHFDIVLLDPPFGAGLITPICRQLDKRNIISTRGLVYIETEAPISAAELPAGWTLTRQKRAASVNYALVEVGSPEAGP